FLRLDDIQPYGLMIYRNKLRMIYTPYGVIRARESGRFYDPSPIDSMILLPSIVIDKSGGVCYNK
ncbi:MAG: hypothetical protein J6B71_11480, partial [Clostridia bacterium]|nr:hypothetical protein [Clostridia bacterium]